MMQRIKSLSEHIKTYALYTDNDVWAPVGDYYMMKSDLPYVALGFKAGLTHAFSTSFEKGNLVRGLMVEELKKILVLQAHTSNDYPGTRVSERIMSKL